MQGDPSDAPAPLAIVAGSGDIPFALAETLAGEGKPVVIFPIIGAADEGRLAGFRHHWVGLGQLGRFMRLARAEGCREIVFIGGLKRPRWWALRLDFAGVMYLPRIIAALRGGDDHLLRNIGRIFEDEGFVLRGAHEFAPQVVMPAGVLTARQPSQADYSDIALGLRRLHANGPFDLGQAVVVASGEVLGLEGADGTDALLRRARRSGTPAGVLVKAPKPAQDRRYDLPAIGPTTVAGVVDAGLSGIAVVAGGGVVAESARMIEAANLAGIFIVGVRDES